MLGSGSWLPRAVVAGCGCLWASLDTGLSAPSAGGRVLTLHVGSGQVGAVLRQEICPCSRCGLWGCRWVRSFLESSLASSQVPVQSRHAGYGEE